MGGLPLLTQPGDWREVLSRGKNPPRLVITDSQAFGPVHSILPEGLPLTSFSILFSRYKGSLKEAVAGQRSLAG